VEGRGCIGEPNQNADSMLRLENAALDKGFDGDLRNASGLRLQDLSESSVISIAVQRGCSVELRMIECVKRFETEFQ
jgi:hypothetical protein